MYIPGDYVQCQGNILSVGFPMRFDFLQEIVVVSKWCPSQGHFPEELSTHFTHLAKPIITFKSREKKENGCKIALYILLKTDVNKILIIVDYW